MRKAIMWVLTVCTLLIVVSHCVVQARVVSPASQGRSQSAIIDTWERDGGTAAFILRDPDNGCQYVSRGRGITPRLNPDGSPMCDGNGD